MNEIFVVKKSAAGFEVVDTRNDTWVFLTGDENEAVTYADQANRDGGVR